MTLYFEYEPTRVPSLMSTSERLGRGLPLSGRVIYHDYGLILQENIHLAITLSKCA